jgi:hypothetical protein
LEQAEANKGPHVPVLFFKRNRSKVYAAVEADVLLNLLANYQGPQNELQSENEAPDEPIPDVEDLS